MVKQRHAAVAATDLAHHPREADEVGIMRTLFELACLLWLHPGELDGGWDSRREIVVDWE